MREYWRTRGWYQLLGILCGFVALACCAARGLSTLPWLEILASCALATLFRRRPVVVLRDDKGQVLLTHIPGEALFLVLMLRHGPEAGAIGNLIANIIGVLLEWSYFMGTPQRALATTSTVLWLPFLVYLRGFLYYHWGGIPIRTFEDCRLLFLDPRNVLLPFGVASALCSDILNRAMQGISLRLRFGRSWRESLRGVTLFTHLEDAGAILSLAIWTAWGWGTLPFVALVVESQMLAGREWARRREARWQATSDPLTGLASARGLSERIQQLMQRHTNFAITYIDMDGFKAVNDCYGHGVGDELLKRFGVALLNATRADDLVARRGGDEFVVVLKNTSRAEAEAFVERIRISVAGALEDEEARFSSITFSAGIALFPGDGMTEQALLDVADTAMYTDKRARKSERLAA